MHGNACPGIVVCADRANGFPSPDLDRGQMAAHNH